MTHLLPAIICDATVLLKAHLSSEKSISHASFGYIYPANDILNVKPSIV